VGQGLMDLRFSPIVARYARLPAYREVSQRADLLGSVTLHLFQGESPNLSQNEYLTTAIVEDRRLREGDRIVLRLSFDEHCVMSIEARDGKSGEPLAVRLDRSRPVSDILRDLGRYEGPKVTSWRPPESRLGKVLGRLFKMFGG
jgi:molecular chaperone DnaK (HSP70)